MAARIICICNPDLDSVHADDVSDLKDFGMVVQLLTEDGAADLLVGRICNLQGGAEVCGQKSSCCQMIIVFPLTWSCSGGGEVQS